MRCMASLPLWRARALLEERAGAFGKARALLEQARLKNPANDVLWLAAVHSEQRAGNAKAAESLIAKGLQVRCSASASLPHGCVQPLPVLGARRPHVCSAACVGILAPWHCLKRRAQHAA